MVARWLAILLTTVPAVETGTADGSDLQRFEFRETHMGSAFKILVYCDDPGVATRAAGAAFDRIARLDEALSDYRPDSELMRLSDQAGGPPVPVSDDLFAVLDRSQRLSERTEGAFDVTINPVVKLWRRARRDRQLPPRARLDEALGRVGWRKLELDPQRRTVRLTEPGMRLDVGGIAKGYASDAALAVLRAHGINRALVAGAGDIVVGDPPPGQDGWIVRIAPLDPSETASRSLLLRNQGVSTSGDAERYVEIDGVRYSHIVDPRTGLGLTGRSSVTVVAHDSTTSDSLATAISVLGPDRGLVLAEQAEGVEALIVSETPGDAGLERRKTTGFETLPTAEPDPTAPAERLGGPES